VDNSTLRATFNFIAAGVRQWRMLRAYYRELFRTESEKRGVKLLREWLSPEQLAQFDGHDYFEVTGCQTGKRCRILYGTQTNIHELDQYGHPKSGWCFVPNEQLVPGDVMLAQKITLETDELGALGIAKSFRPTWH
jgi:hypothetical protein